MIIKARFIMEAMGKPKKLVKDTLNKMKKAIGEKFKVHDALIEEPKKSGDEFYTTFMEITVEFKNIQFFFEFITYYTPTIVEILEPYKLEISAGELENISNDVMGKIHEMDKRLKSAVSVNKILTRKVIQSNTDEKF
ncbi:hypothetical protein COX58_00190 [archaeon CG_4_10_14_0_2_um_filter_Archaea_38_6]|nr:MAG: hypothetical protein COS83_01970 [archaeon CG07_land_8_20_14_0_80_38_8]PIU88434.1 MAG: hypothetical protein COS64_03725 [archaeon CG06_land_8_20_14_3_00_37_11]PJA23136.1 MAG: hypothetical protein COX58_00190 [archaeon CG_4_10_14_0_2_um_filter_Archaea_38_6]